MASIDWFDVAPAVAFALVAGALSGWIGGVPLRYVLSGVAYMVFAALLACAGVACFGFDGLAGFVVSIVASAVLIAPLWLYSSAADRTPVSEVEMDAALQESEKIQIRLAGGERDLGGVHDDAYDVVSQFQHILWRLARDAPRRSEMTSAKDHLLDAIDEAFRGAPN